MFREAALATMSVNYAAGLSPYADKGKCGLPEVRAAGSPEDPDGSGPAARGIVGKTWSTAARPEEGLPWKEGGK